MLLYINIHSGGFAGMPSLDVIQLRLDPFDIQVDLYTICSCCGATDFPLRKTSSMLFSELLIITLYDRLQGSVIVVQGSDFSAFIILKMKMLWLSVKPGYLLY